MADLLMRCGCKADAVFNGHPVCVIHFTTTPKAQEVWDPLPDFTGRRAVCVCGQWASSKLQLPFFEYKPDEPQDVFYCGCKEN